MFVRIRWMKYGVKCTKTPRTKNKNLIGYSYLFRQSTRGVHPPLRPWCISPCFRFAPYFREIFQTLWRIFKISPFPEIRHTLFSKIHLLFTYFLCISFPPYFDHDGFMHHPMHVLDAPAEYHKVFDISYLLPHVLSSSSNLKKCGTTTLAKEEIYIIQEIIPYPVIQEILHNYVTFMCVCMCVWDLYIYMYIYMYI